MQDNKEPIGTTPSAPNGNKSLKIIAANRIQQFKKRKEKIKKIPELKHQVDKYKCNADDFLDFYKWLKDNAWGLKVYFGLDTKNKTISLIYAPTKLCDTGSVKAHLCDVGDYYYFDSKGRKQKFYQIDEAKEVVHAFRFRSGSTDEENGSVRHELGKDLDDKKEIKILVYTPDIVRKTCEGIENEMRNDNSLETIYAHFAAYVPTEDPTDIEISEHILVRVKHPNHLTLIFSFDKHADKLLLNDYNTGAPCPPEVICGGDGLG